MITFVTVKAKIPLFKGEEEARSIDLLQFNEVDFEVVRQKDLSQVGDEFVLIHPDWCLPNWSLFNEYIAPGDDPKKSKLGSNNRVRAVKFNLHRGDGQPVYSNGILLSYEELQDYFQDKDIYKPFNELTSEDLGLTKWEEPENKSGGGNIGGSKSTFPTGLYKTDEPNVLNVNLNFPDVYVGRVKVDGSSITIWYKDGKYGIASRNLGKPLTEQHVVGKRKPTWFEKVKSWFGYKTDLFIYEEREATNDFVRIGKPYLDVLVAYCQKYKCNIALRGELCGKGLKGSGNKANPHANLEPQVLFYGGDWYDNVVERMTNFGFEQTLLGLNGMSNVQFDACPVVFDDVFASKQELYDRCNEYFKTNLVEGIVVRNVAQSAKIMSLEYDAKK